jgi:hypothetical protein
MNRSSHFLEGSPGHTFHTRKETAADGGTKFVVTCPSHPQLSWEGPDEVDAIRTATADMRDRAMRGEV